MTDTHNNTDNRLGITRGPYTILDDGEGREKYVSGSPTSDGGNVICDAPIWAEDSMKRWPQNARLIADAFNVANRTQKLPSEIERENDRLREALRIADQYVAGDFYEICKENKLNWRIEYEYECEGDKDAAMESAAMVFVSEAISDALEPLNPQETP